MFEIIKLRLPIDQNAVPESVSGGWTRSIAGLEDYEVVGLLKERWSAFEAPFLQKLSAAILARKLNCLSIDSDGRQWLSFEGAMSSPLHVAPPSKLSDDLKSRFPFHRIAGFAEFVEDFGGLANWPLPPGPSFISASECRVVASNCDLYDWGMIGIWEGSLPLYWTGTGNCIVVSPENRCAKWNHEIGWSYDDKDPFESLNWSMGDLVEEFITYLSADESGVKSSPFYY